MHQKRGGIGMGMIISILFHAILLLYLPIGWLREAELRIFFLDQYGPVQASIMEELPIGQVKDQTPSTTVASSQPATQASNTVKPPSTPNTQPKVEPKPVTPPKTEPSTAQATTSTSQNVKTIDTTPKPPEPLPEPPVASPVDDDIQDNVIDVASPVVDDDADSIVTTSNPDSPVEITVPSSDTASSAAPVDTSTAEPGTDDNGGEDVLASQDSTDIDSSVGVDEPTELRIPGEQFVVGGVGPTYPKYAQSEGSEGTVALEILVRPDGSIEEVTVVGTSGDSRLDEAARRIINDEWHFNGYVQEYIIPVTVDFKLGSHVGKVTIGEVVIESQ